MARARLAAAAALVMGVVASVIASLVMSASHYLCTWEVGDEAGDGIWLCPDGITYFLPLMAVAGATTGTVLVVYTVVEARRADSSSLRNLAEIATLLGAGVLAVAAIFVLRAGFPAFVAVPYVTVGTLVALARRERTPIAVAALVFGIASCLISLPFLITAPVAAGVASAWSGAVLLHLMARRRAHRLTEGRPS